MMIRVVVVEPRKPARIEIISSDLKSFQAVVGGPIELFQFEPMSERGLDCYCHEEGKLEGLPSNFAVPEDVVVGAVIVSKATRSGNPTDLTEKQAAFVAKFMDTMRRTQGGLS